MGLWQRFTWLFYFITYYGRVIWDSWGYRAAFDTDPIRFDLLIYDKHMIKLELTEKILSNNDNFESLAEVVGNR